MKRMLPYLILLAWFLAVILAMMIDLSPNQIELSGILKPPGNTHWLGQDDLGRSVLHRLLAGAQTSMLVSLWVTLMAGIIGISIGAISAWTGKWVDHVIVRMIDLFMAFPGILLAISLAGILGPGLNNLVIALTVVGWVGFARLTRAQVLSLKNREHIQAAQALGTPTFRILSQHLLPLIAAPLIIEATFTIASVIVAEAGLSFLGIGIQPPEASWGNMIKDGAQYLLVAPHLVIMPGLALAMVVMAINMLGDSLRDHLDKKLHYLT